MRSITLAGIPSESLKYPPDMGQQLSFYPPQRVGDVDDGGAVDIAVLDVSDGSSYSDGQRDVCLLFRGRPVKCFVLKSSSMRVYDTSTSAAIVYPAREDNMEDAVAFMEVSGALPGHVVRVERWDVGGVTPSATSSYSRSPPNTATLLTGSTAGAGAPHGLQVGSVVKINEWQMQMDLTLHKHLTGNRFIVESVTEYTFSVRIPATFLWGRYLERVDGVVRMQYAQASETCTPTGEYGSTISEFIGCTNMAPRCAPGTAVTDCAEAVEAALALKERVSLLNTDVIAHQNALSEYMTLVAQATAQINQSTSALESARDGVLAAQECICSSLETTAETVEWIDGDQIKPGYGTSVT